MPQTMDEIVSDPFGSQDGIHEDEGGYAISGLTLFYRFWSGLGVANNRLFQFAVKEHVSKQELDPIFL